MESEIVLLRILNWLSLMKFKIIDPKLWIFVLVHSLAIERKMRFSKIFSAILIADFWVLNRCHWRCHVLTDLFKLSVAQPSVMFTVSWKWCPCSSAYALAKASLGTLWNCSGWFIEDDFCFHLYWIIGDPLQFLAKILHNFQIRSLIYRVLLLTEIFPHS